jgi:hypothetical protein
MTWTGQQLKKFSVSVLCRPEDPGSIMTSSRVKVIRAQSSNLFVLHSLWDRNAVQHVRFELDPILVRVCAKLAWTRGQHNSTKKCQKTKNFQNKKETKKAKQQRFLLFR